MARTKTPPQKAPEYKKKPPGKAKDGSKCYTRVNKGGGAYVTCEGKQKSNLTKNGKVTLKTQAIAKKRKAERAAKPKAKSAIGGRPAGLKVKVGTLNKGKVIKATPKVDKDLLQKVLPIMASVGKEKGVVKVPFKIRAREMRDLKFRWELWWRKNGFLGGRDYKIMPTRVANAVFTSQKSMDDKGDREKIFEKLQSLIGDGNMYDGTTWKSITKKDLLK